MPYLIIIDSGAAGSVLPRHWCPHAKLQHGPTTGETYSSANGSPIRNEGEKVVSMITKQGQWKNMASQVCDVTRPLAPVSKIAGAGHSVVFNQSRDTRGSYIQNASSGEDVWLTAKDGVYALGTTHGP